MYTACCSVHRMLDLLGWPFLEQRRETSRLGVVYKTYSGPVQCPIIKTKLVPPPPRQRRTLCQQLSLITTVQRRFLFTPHHQGLELSLQGCSRGDDCRHFCVTRLPLTSQLFFFLFFFFFFLRRNLRQCNNLRTCDQS